MLVLDGINFVELGCDLVHIVLLDIEFLNGFLLKLFWFNGSLVHSMQLWFYGLEIFSFKLQGKLQEFFFLLIDLLHIPLWFWMLSILIFFFISFYYIWEFSRTCFSIRSIPIHSFFINSSIEKYYIFSIPWTLLYSISKRRL